MSIEIKETSHETIIIKTGYVDNNPVAGKKFSNTIKEMFRDQEGRWISNDELTVSEQKALNNYLLDYRPTNQLKTELLEGIFKEIKEERQRQDSKFGPQNHTPPEWLMILGEEVGEVNKAALETHFKHENSKKDYSDYRTELIQVAAVAIAMIECLDRV